MGRTFIMGDIHGAYLALRQCLEKSSFDYNSDTLICLGDVCDGWPQTRECIDELLLVKNLVYILGNHDFWSLNWMEYGEAENIWLDQGGAATIASYKDPAPKSHLLFLKNARPFYVMGKSLFVHAGILPGKKAEECGLNILIWDRTLAQMAIDFSNKGIDAHLTEYEEVFIGHTPISSPHPIRCCEVWLMDTGAGWSGVLSMMDFDTRQFFVSDSVPTLYPNVEGRKKFGGVRSRD